MKIEVNIEKKYAYGILALLLVLIGVVAVNAFGTSNPLNFGHSVGEMDWSGEISKINVNEITGQNFNLDGSNNKINKNLTIDNQGATRTIQFTGNQQSVLTLKSGNFNNNFTILGFDGDRNKSIAQIGMRQTAAGSWLHFGTSNNYASGITHTGLTISPTGDVRACSGGKCGSPVIPCDWIGWSSTCSNCLRFGYACNYVPNLFCENGLVTTTSQCCFSCYESSSGW